MPGTVINNTNTEQIRINAVSPELTWDKGLIQFSVSRAEEYIGNRQPESNNNNLSD